jgi:predicted metal-binding protein
MRRKPPPRRSLADRVPEVAAEWHPSLNGDLTPSDVFAGSAERFWWQCATCGHEWETKLEKRVKQGQGCRKCAAARRAKAQATPKPGQSLADLMPELASEWHPTLNPDRTPSDVVPTSGALIWWLCPRCRHEWRASVYRRSIGIGCRKCAAVRTGVLRATPKPGESFADQYPDVAAEWHRTLNGDLKPSDVKPASNKRVWWQCAQGHEWSVSPSNRRRREQCPECAEVQRSLTKSTPKPDQSLADLHPDISAEWHPSKNAPLTAADVNPGSKAKRWWRCRTCGHDWKTDPDKRTSRSYGCPNCRYARSSVTKSTPKPGESLAEKMPELAAEWHPDKNGDLTPADVRPRGNASVWWRCRFGHEWKAKVAPRAVGIGCPQCSIIGISERQTRLEYELAAAGLPVEHDYSRIPVEGRRAVKVDIAIPTLHVIVEYDGSYYHAKKARADRAQTAALVSAGWTVLRVREIPLRPLGGNEIFVGSAEPIKSVTLKTLHALRGMGHLARHLSRYENDSELWADRAAKDALYRFRAKSLASELPSLASEFHPDKNEGITPDKVHPGSNTTFWWMCAVCGHEWQQKVAIRVRGHGCPPCSVQRRAKKRAQPTPGKSFADLFPEVAKEWHPTLNGPLTASDVTPASGKIVWWQCPRGHEWQARVADRREFGRCKKCRSIDSAK